MSVRRLLFIALLGGASVSAYADKTISGNVKDDTGQPAIGATVQVEGTTIGTMTDLDGNYTLTVPDDTREVTISYVGLATQTVQIKGNVANADLKADDKTLEDVVVVGYQTVKKRDVVASTASVGAEQIKNLPVTDAAQAMQGKMAGVQVVQSEGSPDADVTIRVRGGNSLTQSSTPLYIVDGFPVSSINDISPTDIQSIDVLKDAAATAIYGAQGANGVIIITTKDAQANDSEDCGMKFHVDYTGYMGWKTLAKKYDVLSAEDFARLQYEYAYLAKKGVANNVAGAWNAYFDKTYSGTGPATTSFNDVIADIRTKEETDWQEKTFGNTGFTSNHSFTVSAANKKSSFNLSYNRIDDKGIMKESDYTRNNINFKAKFKPLKDLTMGANFRFTNTTVLGSGANTAEDAGSKTENRVVNAIAYTPIAMYSADKATEGLDEESFGSLFDPITTIYDNYKFKRDNKYDMNGYASYKFLKKFTGRVDLGYQARYIDVDRFYGATTYYSRAGTGYSKAGGVAGKVSGIRTSEEDSRLRESATLEYKDKFAGAHNLNLMIGQEMIRNKGELNTNYGWGYPGNYTGEYLFDHFGSYYATGNAQYINPNDNMLSFFGRATYDYKGRYYLTGTFRADCSTRFSKGNQWGYFPAMAAAWRVSDESWMRSFARASKMSNLKLRLSYGVAGNNNVELGAVDGDFSLVTDGVYLSSTSFENTSYFMTAGGTEKIVPNDDLTWETTTTRDLGLDFGFFNDRLSGTIDLYWNSTKDLIIKYKLPTTGYQYRNVAETKNLGAEFSIKGVILDKRSKNFNYNLTVDANISRNNNSVVDLGGMKAYYVSTNYLASGYFTTDEFIVEEDKSIGRIYGFETDGYYTAADFDGYNAGSFTWTKGGVPVASNYGVNSVAYPGLVKIKDRNGDGQITAEDRTVIGCTMPEFTGGFSISGSIGSDKWGQVDAAANFTYSYGNDVLNLTGLSMSTVQDKTKLRNTLYDKTNVNARYTLFDADGVYIPSKHATYAAIASELNAVNANASEASPVTGYTMLTDQCVEDGSFLRLATVTIGYSLPDKWITKAKLTKARVFFSASNLFVITNYSGDDPEVNTGTKRNPLAVGVDWSAYPRSRNFNFGVNLSF